MNRIFKVFSISVLSLLSFLFLLTASALPVFGEEEIDPVPSESHTVILSLDNFATMDDTTQVIYTEDYIITITVEDIPTITPMYLEEQWGLGVFNKRIKANMAGTAGDSMLAKLTAVFTGSVNPGQATINSVSQGEFNATLMTPTGEKFYEIIIPQANPSQRGAYARYREKYTFNGVGQHDMALFLFINTSGRAQIGLDGIW